MFAICGGGLQMRVLDRWAQLELLESLYMYQKCSVAAGLTMCLLGECLFRVKMYEAGSWWFRCKFWDFGLLTAMQLLQLPSSVPWSSQLQLDHLIYHIVYAI